jgi:UDP-N-acetylmuramate dehydrogenase
MQKEYNEQPFIIFNNNFSLISRVNNTLIEAQAGSLLRDLSIFALEASLSGLEVFYDIPASVGGALWMNAGAYGSCIYDYVDQVTTIHRITRKIKVYNKDELIYSYRKSMFQNNEQVILSASFCLVNEKQNRIKEKISSIYNTRRSKLPSQPSAGSVFKRPKYHISVGEMVEELGLKGYSIGGAMISSKHGGVIVNYNDANSEDIYALINFIKKAILKEYQVTLELEQIII